MCWPPRSTGCAVSPCRGLDYAWRHGWRAAAEHDPEEWHRFSDKIMRQQETSCALIFDWTIRGRRKAMDGDSSQTPRTNADWLELDREFVLQTRYTSPYVLERG